MDRIKNVLIGIFQILGLGILIGLAIGLLLVMAALIITPFSYVDCITIADMSSEQNIQWSFWSGCLVETENGHWIDVDNYFVIESADGVQIDSMNLPAILKGE